MKTRHLLRGARLRLHRARAPSSIGARDAERKAHGEV
jgi:hypothetical protein